ncbi:cytidylyltransferase [Flavobacterium sp. LC2016-01]|uniref:acylneuraminate cytidylyltransferase family protein n=1 Tax=Flavobacterium sp. LC2016-01 TaxID=2675876 RepID=UPI0012BB1CC3|nr:cytidylyltransferase [Flavobacterium sp. LC2016-01]MTH18088.1 cytidylyltransferase [Flavobacterium sp. LC2016-01]
MKITAVIPVRIGSERVKNKNLKAFGDTSLLELKIDNLLKVKSFDEIIVNTDSDEAIEIAKSKGISYHRREDYYASSKCTNSEFLQHLGLVTKTDIFAYCPCTTPFILPSTIEKSIESFIATDIYDCLATVSSIKEFLWQDGNPINYERDKQPNSQNLPDIMALNFGLNLISREALIKYKNIVGLNPLFQVTDEIEGLDIDTPLDFFIAEQIYSKGSDFFKKI